jgi:hypothetical protein
LLILHSIKWVLILNQDAIEAIAWLRSIPEDSPLVYKELDALKADIEMTKTKKTLVQGLNVNQLIQTTDGIAIAFFLF